MELKSQIIDLLVGERKRQGLTQADLAFRADWAKSFVAKIEQGLGDRATSAYQRYADALGVDFEISLVDKQITEEK